MHAGAVHRLRAAGHAVLGASQPSGSQCEQTCGWCLKQPLTPQYRAWVQRSVCSALLASTWPHVVPPRGFCVLSAACGLALLQLSTTLCKGTGPRVSDSSSRLCHYLPVVQEQISLAIGILMFWNALLAVVTLAVACAGSWHFWELGYVEKKATKHKRRRKQRKRSVPWDKIKVRRRAKKERGRAESDYIPFSRKT